MKSNRRLRVRVRYILFHSELALTDLWCNITCSRLYLGGENMRRKFQMNNLVTRLSSSVVLFFSLFFYVNFSWVGEKKTRAHFLFATYVLNLRNFRTGVTLFVIKKMFTLLKQNDQRAFPETAILDDALV